MGIAIVGYSFRFHYFNFSSFANQYLGARFTGLQAYCEWFVLYVFHTAHFYLNSIFIFFHHWLLRPFSGYYKQKRIGATSTDIKEGTKYSNAPIDQKREWFKRILAKNPPIFSDWFRERFTTPHNWYEARNSYVRTTAVMSIVGYILGLGDRHGENILFDSVNGDTVHVDFNCLFNKGELFEVPEVVPFRLTHNMVIRSTVYNFVDIDQFS